ncbi:MAG: TonB-dependent receptor [Bacteroidota bacterium]
MKRILLALVCFISYSVAIQSQDELEFGDSSFYQLQISDLNQVTVASNVITEGNKQPVSITTITSEELRLSGARLLSEAIMFYVPGFFLVEDQDDLISGFRGMAADNNSKVLLLLDGQNLNTEFFWGPTDAILNSITFDYIERVEVIRGPGSVTLGQGALLGVINIITKNGGNLKETEGGKSDIVFELGADGRFHGSGDYRGRHKNGLDTYFYVSTGRYNGQELQDRGWAQIQTNEGFAGGTVADMGHGLRRADNVTMMGNIHYKGFSANLTYVDQTRDLYNFYRDREIFQQILTNISGSYVYDFSSDIRITSSLSYAQDHIGLYSRTGTTMGGTREDRIGFKSVLNFDNLFPNNKTAIGFEIRHFRMGKRNLHNNNFIANVVNSFDPTTANDELTMGFRRNIEVGSLFFENVYNVNSQLDVFFAARGDSHPFWGTSFTPRLGAIYFPNQDLRLRASFQSGFRGAVGLHYTGGYRRDGHLRADNYAQVGESGIPNEDDITQTEPERMDSFELAANYKVNSRLSIDGVFFFNQIANVIDVGVIYREPSDFDMIPVGNDIPGDWNGYWFFKNTPGSFSQAGFEGTVSFETTNKKLRLGASYAMVRVLGATEEQKEIARSGNSMYLSSNTENDNLHFKAYPEHVVRMQVMARPVDKLTLSLVSMGYSGWYSPIGTKAEGGLMMNLAGTYQVTKNIGLSLTAKNLLNEDALYPMNSNAGGPDVSPGTPAWETTTWWAQIRVSL